jgi:hypothetical protein
VVTSLDGSLEHGALYVHGPFEEVSVTNNEFSVGSGLAVWLREEISGLFSSNTANSTVRNDSNTGSHSNGFSPPTP